MKFLLFPNPPLSGDLRKVAADAVRCPRIIEDRRVFAWVPKVERG